MKWLSAALAGAVGVALGAAAGALGAQEQSPASGPEWAFDWQSQIPQQRPAATVRSGFTFAAAGDMIYSQPIMPRKDPGVEAIAAVIREADAALANQEGSIFELETFEGYPEALHGGGYPVGRPELAADIAGFGFDFAAKANNHAVDFGTLGMMESKWHLEQAGVLAPGVGRDRAFARAASISNTPGGRVAVISAASTFPASAPAGEGHGIAASRPGLNAIRTRRVVLVTPEDMQSLKSIAAKYGSGFRRGREDEVNLWGQQYRVGDQPGVTYDINDVDRFEILRTIRGAKNVADAVVFTVHGHENAGMGDNRVPADFHQVLFRNAVDAGADIVAVHGPHITRGIEVYQGKPIFYGLGHFVYQMLGSAPVMRESFEARGIDPRYVSTGDDDLGAGRQGEYDGIVAVTEFGDGGAVREIRLFPVDMRPEELMKTRGIPRLATGQRAAEILDQVRIDSAAYGTDVQVRGGVGIIRPSHSSARDMQ